VLPVAAGAVAAATAWALSHVAKALADRPQPYEVVAGAVLRQQSAHGTSFPSTHTAVTVAVVIALVPFLPRRWPRWRSRMPSWWAGPGCTWACTTRLTSWAEQASAWR
jgi:membrane-associated phospholipid phosphatase